MYLYPICLPIHYEFVPESTERNRTAAADEILERIFAITMQIHEF